HGDAFARYCAAVPRLLPTWRKAATPPSVEVNVAVYRKAFIDAASFMLIFVLLKLLDALHAAGRLPTLLELW
ncbi:MAG: hypothetical protein HC872_03805, partial [Gammaproteobacteria bacterium]|nr:hypothetical protein [Gammaproteobacteria bacterium]